MSDALERFNALSSDEGERELYGCFAHRDWALRVAAGRPYRDVDSLMASAEAAWSRLGEADWLDAFAAHPRIGESGGHAPDTSAREQHEVARASNDTLGELAAENRRYEARFGRVFIIAAAGRGAEEILAELRRRMSNDPATELEVAAGEQRKITRLRLCRLVRG